MPTYKEFLDGDVISVAKSKTYPLWSDSPLDPDTLGEAILTAFYTSSAETTASFDSNYFWNIYQERVDPTPAGTGFNFNAPVQFCIAVGATGSIPNDSFKLFTTDDVLRYTFPANAIYRQFANIVTQQGSDAVIKTYTDSAEVDIAYIIAVARDRMKDGIDPTTFQIRLIGTGSKQMTFIADQASSVNQTDFDIFSGSINTNTGVVTYWNGIASGSRTGQQFPYGKLYANKGVIMFDANKIEKWNGQAGPFGFFRYFVGSPAPGLASALTGSYSFATPLADGTDPTSDGYRPFTVMNNFYSAISGSVTSASFQARSTEVVQATHYFVRVKNNEFNSSENPTWRSGSNNEIRDVFYTNPTTFITSVGLYDGTDPNVPGKLVAVAKLSKPLMKTTDSEALIRIRLDF